MDKRLASKELYLRRQFTSMETMLAQLNSQGNELAARLGTAGTSNDKS